MIRPATPEDYRAIRNVTIDAFDAAEEAAIIERLRKDGDALIELVEEKDGAIVGHIMFSKMTSDAGRFAALGPLAVASARQSEGIGGDLTRAGIEACRALGIDALVVLGHAKYYPRFGFSHEATKLFQGQYNHSAYMAMDLTPGALARGGIVRYAQAFGV